MDKTAMSFCKKVVTNKPPEASCAHDHEMLLRPVTSPNTFLEKRVFNSFIGGDDTSQS